MNMRSLNSLVTDSSAASSSWGSGTRIINGVVNQMGNGTPLKTLYELLGQAGWKRGLVTTTEITHATPAGFATSIDSRDKAPKIAEQYLKREVEVLLGGGRKFFDKAYRLDKRDLQGEFAKAGYATFETLAELSVAPTSKRWLGLFSRSHLPYTVDHQNDPKLRATVPTLATMTAAALRRLENEKHFILQVEGGRVDHGCHNNDAAAALYDQLALDEAIEVCLEFQKRVPDTLIVMTSDHGNGNLGLNGMGDAYGQSTWLFANLRKVKQSFPVMMRPLKRQPAEDEPDKEKDDEADKAREKAKSNEQKEREKIAAKIKEENVATPTEIIQIVEEGTGYKMPYRKAELFRANLANAGESLYDMRKSDVCALGDVLANYLGIGFSGNAHTGDFVPVLALGPGAERFGAFIENTDVFGHYLAFAGIDFRNPQEPVITAEADLRRLDRTTEDTDAYRLT
jgi:alkaline phosphatase